MFFDAIVIFGSIILVIFDILLDSKKFSSISKIFRGIFRFLRIFLLFRKVNQFKKIKVTYSRYDVKTPVEKIMEILSNLKENLGESEQIVDIEWCIEIISSNKLYDPIVDNFGKDGQGEKNDMMNWIANYSTEKQRRISVSSAKSEENLARKRNSLYIQDGMRRTSIMPKEKNIEIPENVLEYLKSNADELEFNCFHLNDISEANGTSLIILHLFQENSLFENLDINQNVLYEFSKKIQNGYLDNPYHNRIHSSDIIQTTNFFLKKCKYQELAELTNQETAAMYIAAMIHDYEHPGINNAFHIATKMKLAVRYNGFFICKFLDKSVLEMHHVAASYLILQQKEYNIFQNFSKEDYYYTRERIISMVNLIIFIKDFTLSGKDKTITMDIIIHASDISNPFKPWDICYPWTMRVLSEFFNQGDQERDLGLQISHLMDRYTVNVSKSQIGFINIITQPTYEVVKSFLPILGNYMKNFDNNKAIWTEKIDYYEEELSLFNFYFIEKLNDEKNRNEKHKEKDENDVTKEP